MAAFKEWVRAEALEETSPLEEFRGTCIGIDADDYLTTLLSTAHTREPLLPALGGLPFALEKHVDQDLANFRNMGIRPLFVFNGVQVASRDRAMVRRESQKLAKMLDDAWAIYDQGRGEDSVNAFGKACSYKIHHISRYLRFFLRKRNIETLCAPAAAAAQLAQLPEQKICDGVMGSASCLVFGADKVITRFDFEAGTASWVEATTCQGRLLLPESGFVDIMLLAGCVPFLLPAIPEADVEGSRAIQVARSLVAPFNGDGYAMLLRPGQQDVDKDYVEAFKKARFAVRHAIYMLYNGLVVLRQQDKAPGDAHDFNGRRLPDELYKYLWRGLIGSRVLSWCATGQIVEIPPLDGGNSQPYMDLIQNKLVDLRQQSLAVIAAPLHRYFQFQKLDVSTWFSDEVTQLSFNERTEAAKTARGKWLVQTDSLSEDMAIRPLTAALSYLSDTEKAKSTTSKNGKTDNGLLSQKVEVLANATFHFLQDTGFVGADHNLTMWGKALKIALDRAKENGAADEAVTPTEIDEALFMAFQLLKLRVLNTHNLFPTTSFSGAPLRGTDTDKANTLLISRIASLAYVRHVAIGYTGPLSRHLLAYHQMAATVRASLRDLLEVHATSLCLSGLVVRQSEVQKPKVLTDLGAALPFTREPDLGLALVVKSYLDELSNDAAKRSDISKWFNYVTDLDADLQKAWRIWDAVNAGVQGAEEGVANATTKGVFSGADDWLKEKKAAATNGAV